MAADKFEPQGNAAKHRFFLFIRVHLCSSVANPFMKLENKIALVTGAGKGIGRGIAQTLAAEGAKVWLVARTESDLKEVETKIIEDGGKAEVCAGDVTDESFVARLFERVRKDDGRLDILVNNAGVGTFGPTETLPVADLRACLELNIVAVFSCTQQAVRLMKENGDEGKIINIGSIRSHWSEGGDSGAYNASKYGLRGLTESIARELHGTDSKIAVGLVCPGIVDTTLTNPGGEPRPGWMNSETIGAAVLHAVCAPSDVNVFDTIVFPLAQKPW